MSTYRDTVEPAGQKVVAFFATRGDADQSVTRLLNVGFPAEDIAVLEPADVTRLKKPVRRRVDWTFVGAVVTAFIGGLMGAFVGLPDIFFMIVASVGGIGLGAYAGGIVGGLLGGEDGIPDEPFFLQQIRAGRILVSAHVPDREGEVMAAAVLYESRALQVDTVVGGGLRARVHHPSVEVEAA